MLNIIQNTIGAIRRVGESVVRAGLKMWLPFTKAEPLGENVVVNGDFATDSDWSPFGLISDNKANIIGDGTTFVFIKQNNVFEEGKVYICVFDVTITSGLGLKFQDGANNENIGFATTSGVYTFHFTAGSNSDLVIGRRTGGTPFESYVNSVSIHEYAQETPDISGNDNNAILKTGKALQFTGNDSVQTSFPSSYTIKTIAFWINPTHSSTNEVVFYGGGAMGGTRELRLDHLQLEAINGNINMNTYVNGTLEGVTYGGTPATLTQDEWQRVVLTSSTGFTVVSDTFDIASGLYGSDGRFIMSDLQIYDETWTTDDIAYDYANPQKLVTDSEDTSITLDNLKAWWHMSEGDGTIAFDSAPLIGKELVVNGDFATDSDWTESTQSDISGGKARILSTDGSYQYIQQSNSGFTNTQGKFVKITLDIVEYVSGTIKAQFAGGSNYIFPQSIGTHTLYVQNDGSSGTFNIARVSGVTDITIDNVSLKEVYNIDGETYDGSSLGASYVDAQERIPQLGMMNWSKGSNLLTYSEDFSESEWHKGGSPTLESGYLAPDGTMTAYKITIGTAVTHIADQFVQTTSDRKTKSLWARTVSGTGIVTLLNYFGENNSQYTLTEEWQRFEVSGTLSSNEHFYLVDFRHATNSLNEVIVWGAQLEADDGSVTAYRRTNGTAVTDATLISSATDSQKDILSNAVRVKGNAFNLDGTGYGEVTHDTSLDFGTGDFSFSAWAKFSYISQGSSYNAIYTNGGLVDSAGTFAIMSLNTNKIRIFVDTTHCSSTTLFSQGEWVHIVATRNSGTISLYINGNKTPEDTNTNSDSVTSSQNPRIGYDGNNARFYNDLIDDVQVYNRALTPDEVEQNYNATKTGHNN